MKEASPLKKKTKQFIILASSLRMKATSLKKEAKQGRMIFFKTPG